MVKMNADQQQDSVALFMDSPLVQWVSLILRYVNFHCCLILFFLKLICTMDLQMKQLKSPVSFVD